MIQSRVPVLRVAKEQAEGRKLPYRVLSEETGLSVGALQRLMEPAAEVDRIDGKTISRLCEYFGVSVGELLVYVPAPGTESAVATSSGQ